MEIRAEIKARKRSHSTATASFRNAEIGPKVRARRREGFFSILLRHQVGEDRTGGGESFG